MTDTDECSGGRLACLALLVLVCAGVAHGKYGGGNGNGDNPYLIFTAEHLAKIGLDPNDWDKHFKLMSDIDMRDYNTAGAFHDYRVFQWDPYISKPFKGVFDGNKKKIINLYFTHIGHDFAGLFGYVFGQGALIKDLTLV